MSIPSTFAATLEALEETQRKAVLADHKTPLLVSAGAGSGKTRVLTMRIAALMVHQHVRPEQILALTFTKKACEEMQERVQKLCPHIARHALAVKTFHSFCLDVVKDNYSRLNFPHEPTVLDKADQADIVRACIEELGDSKKAQVQGWRLDENQNVEMAGDETAAGFSNKAYSSKDQSKGLAAAIAYFLAWLRKSAQSRTTSGGQGLLGEDDDDMHEAGCRRKNFTKGNGAGQLKMSVEEELKAKYEAEKKRRNLVDFDDMVPCALTLLRRDVLVRQRLQSRFQYILVDECQDVSEGQFALLEAMASGISSPSITACGDPDQSIYAFLNGCARNNFDEFMSTWPTSVLIKLRKNFRSDQMIVRAAAAVIAKNPETPTSTAKHSWTDNQDGLPISICSFSSVEREVNWVCDQVAQCKSDGVPLRQMAILFRQRSHGKPFEKELRKRGIGAVNSSPSDYGSPYQKSITNDLLAYLQLALEDDDKSFARVLNKPKRGLGDQTLEKLRQTQGRFKCSMFQAAKKASRQELKGSLTPAQQKGLQSFIRVISDLRLDVQNKSSEEVLRNLVKRVYCSDAGSCKKKGNDSEQFEATKMITAMIADLPVTAGLDDDIGAAPRSAVGASEAGGCAGKTARMLKKFLTSVKALDKEGLKKMRESEVVRLSTIHAAKGLEFLHVWVIQMGEGKFPTRPNLDHCADEEDVQRALDEWLQEERRIAYVALTRAKKRLNISWVSRDPATGDPVERSRFVEEIPEAFKISAKDAAAAAGGATNATAASAQAAKLGDNLALRPLGACISGVRDADSLREGSSSGPCSKKDEKAWSEGSMASSKTGGISSFAGRSEIGSQNTSRHSAGMYANAGEAVWDDALQCDGSGSENGKRSNMLVSSRMLSPALPSNPPIVPAGSRTPSMNLGLDENITSIATPQSSWASSSKGAVLQPWMAGQRQPGQRLVAEKRNTIHTAQVGDKKGAQSRALCSPDPWQAHADPNPAISDVSRPAGRWSQSGMEPDLRVPSVAYLHPIEGSERSSSCTKSPALASGHPTLHAGRRDSRFSHSQRSDGVLEGHMVGMKRSAVIGGSHSSPYWKEAARGEEGGGVAGFDMNSHSTEPGGQRFMGALGKSGDQAGRNHADSNPRAACWIDGKAQDGSSLQANASGAQDPYSRPYSRSPPKRARFVGAAPTLETRDLGSMGNDATRNGSGGGLRVVGNAGGGCGGGGQQFVGNSKKAEAPRRKLLGFRSLMMR